MYKRQAVGYLMQKEIDFLGNAVNNPARPFVAILGGSKVSSKISVINNLLDKVDTLIIGGGMAYTFMTVSYTHLEEACLRIVLFGNSSFIIYKYIQMNRGRLYGNGIYTAK